MANVKKFSKSKNGNTKLSNNFSVKEFACHDGSDSILIDIDMIPVLQYIRDTLGPVTINSAYRTPAYNLKVGGATNSYHKYGRAFDTCVSGHLNDICGIASALGVKGIIRYSSFVHIDTRTSKYHHNNVTGQNVTFVKYPINYSSVVKKRLKIDSRRYSSIQVEVIGV